MGVMPERPADWLVRRLDEDAADVAAWPRWMQHVSGFEHDARDCPGCRGGRVMQGYAIRESVHGERIQVLVELDDGEYRYTYVSEPGWLARLFGDTLERRLAAARRRVTRWAEGQLRKQDRLWKALDGQERSS